MTRDAEHTPSPQSVVVPDRAMEQIAFNLCSLHDFDPAFVSGQERFARAVITEFLRAAPAPSSLAGGSVGRLSALLSSDHLRGDYPISGLGAVSWNDLRAILAALSPEAPAREGGEDWTADDLEALISGAIGDSMDMDWTYRDGAKAVLCALNKEGLLLTPFALTPRHEAPASEGDAS